MLDPQARALLDLMAANGVPPVHTLTPADARRFYLERRFFTQPEPPAVAYAAAEMSPMARSFYGESKRVSNDRIKRELGVILRHPDYRHGLAALLRDATPGS